MRGGGASSSKFSLMEFKRMSPQSSYATGFIPVETGFCTNPISFSGATSVVHKPVNHRDKPGGERKFACLRMKCLGSRVHRLTSSSEGRSAGTGSRLQQRLDRELTRCVSVCVGYLLEPNSEEFTTKKYNYLPLFRASCDCPESAVNEL